MSKEYQNLNLKTEIKQVDLFTSRKIIKPCLENAKKIIKDEIKTQKTYYKSWQEMLERYGGFYSGDGYGVSYSGYQEKPNHPDYSKVVVEINEKEFQFDLKKLW